MVWPCNVIRMDETRIPTQLFYRELVHGSCNQGHPRKRYKDNLRTNVKWAGLQPGQLEGAATNRTNWRALIRRATVNLEHDRRQRLAMACNRQHRAASTPALTTGVPCPTCNRLCASAFGLQSHMHVHQLPSDYHDVFCCGFLCVFFLSTMMFV